MAGRKPAGSEIDETMGIDLGGMREEPVGREQLQRDLLEAQRQLAEAQTAQIVAETEAAQALTAKLRAETDAANVRADFDQLQAERVKVQTTSAIRDASFNFLDDLHLVMQIVECLRARGITFRDHRKIKTRTEDGTDRLRWQGFDRQLTPDDIKGISEIDDGIYNVVTGDGQRYRVDL